MTIHSFRRRALVPLAGLLGLALLAIPALTATEQDEKTLFLSVVDKDGKSVTDLTTPEIAILEDSADERDVINVKKSTQPLAIVVLADTTKQAGGTGMMSSQTSQTGAAELIRDIRVSVAASVNCGMTTAARMPRMITTINNSTKVKARFLI